MFLNRYKINTTAVTFLLLVFVISLINIQALALEKDPFDELLDSAVEEQISDETKDPQPLTQERDKEHEKNLFATAKQGGPLMIVLILLGILGMTIIIERLIYYTRNRVWKIETMDDILSKKAQQSTARYREDLEDEVRSAFQIYANSLERGLPLLSGIGNISPIIGFLGTVIGMISAFAAIAAATTVNAKVVAVGIQIALVTTAGGLVVAAPTLVFFYLFTHLIQSRYSRAEEFITGLCETRPRISDRICEEESIEQ